MKNYNLLDEKWIPFRQIGGTNILASPSFMSAAGLQDVVTTRPDFRAALYEFLIGLLQTTCAPENEDEWEEWYFKPPSSDELRQRFESVKVAFNLDGDGFRFLQDESKELTGTKRIDQLLLEAPGDQTLKHNKDHFLKRPDEEIWFSRPAIAMALITRSLYDPGFGGGFRGALRGPGPLTTLLVGETFWQTIWLNVLPRSEFRGDTKLPTKLSQLFGWMGPCRTSEKVNKKEKPPTMAEDLHPFAVYWGIPNRVQIDFEEGVFECGITGEPGTVGARSLTAQQYGTNYQPPFFHPLSPHSHNLEKQTDYRFLRGQHLVGAGSTFRSWVGVTVSNESKFIHPARVISYYRELRRDLVTTRTWCFGYELRQALALNWHEHLFPLLDIPEGQLKDVTRFASQLVESADLISWGTRQAIQRALYEKNVDGKWVKGSASINQKTYWEGCELEFWNNLDPLFFEFVEAFLQTPSNRKTEAERWLQELQHEAIRRFDATVYAGDLRAVDPRSAALARRDLRTLASAWSKKMRTILDIQKPEKKEVA